MGHNHSHHGHSHGHSHAPGSYNKAFAIAVTLNFAFVVVQASYAIIAHSMSLLADAGHNLGDVLGLLFAWGANWLLTRDSGDRFSYGHRKSTILAALANALLLVLTSGIIAYESVLKLIHQSSVEESIVIIVAMVGIFINSGTALLFMRGRNDDLNIKGAFLHLAYDALISFGVVVTGILIYYTDAEWLDPIVGLAIVVMILFGTWGLLRDSVNLILDAVPHNVDQDAVRKYLSEIPNVKAVHDLHIWGLSTSESALTAHLVIPEGELSDMTIQKVNEDMHHHYNINHVTLQVEKGDKNHPCSRQESC